MVFIEWKYFGGQWTKQKVLRRNRWVVNAFSSSETKTESNMASTSISTSTSTGAPATAIVPAVTTVVPKVTAISLEAALARALEDAMPRLVEWSL